MKMSAASDESIFAHLSFSFLRDVRLPLLFLRIPIRAIYLYYYYFTGSHADDVRNAFLPRMRLPTYHELVMSRSTQSKRIWPRAATQIEVDMSKVFSDLLVLLVLHIIIPLVENELKRKKLAVT
jgi:hypothetical protein